MGYDRILLLGDIHGCLDELDELWTKLKPHPAKDRVVFLGDLVDKGPASAEVVKFVYSKYINSVTPITVIEGNHESNHLRWWNHVKADNGREKRVKNHASIARIQAQLTDAERDFLFTAPAYQLLGVQAETLAVHAGVLPDLNPFFHPRGVGQYRQDAPDPVREKFLRIRFVNASNEYVSLDQRTQESVHWSEKYAGVGGTIKPRVFYGHTAWTNTDRPRIVNKTYGLDLGCVYGNRLCAYVIEADGTEYWVTVKAKKAYASLYADKFA